MQLFPRVDIASVCQRLFLLVGLFFAYTPLYATQKLQVIAIAETLDLYLKNSPAGIITHSISTDTNVQAITEITTLDVYGAAYVGASPGASASTQFSEIRRYSNTGPLLCAELSVHSPGGLTHWSIVKEASAQWILTITTGGQKNVQQVAVPVSDHIGAILDLYNGIKTGTVKIGNRWVINSFDLMSGVSIPTIITCTTVPSQTPSINDFWTFTCFDSTSNRTEVWKVGKDLKTIEQDIYGMFTAKKRGFKNRGSADGASRHSDISVAFAVPVAPECDKREYPLGLSFVNESLHPSVKNLYTQSKKVFIPLYNSPDTGRWTIPDSLKIFTKSTVTMQSEAPEIKSFVQKALSVERFAQPSRQWDTIAACARYVFNHTQKRPTATFSNALETLRSGFGDCGEHAVLCGAMLRSIGIPARIVLGLVYVPKQKQCMYHAWVMVWAGKWGYVDPALGNIPGTVGLFPLVIDDTGEQAIALVRLIGKISIGCGE